MRASVSSALISLALAALAMWPPPGRTQPDRDFVFTDLVGHLVLRFAGTGRTGLDSSQLDEVSDSEFSRMVHDRLRADLLFEDEPRDPEWAASMEPQIEEHVKHAGPEFSAVAVECRAASCRLMMKQPGRWSVPEHQAVLDTIQASLDAFIAAHRQDFEPVFLLAAYDKESQTAHIEAFLRRTAGAVAHRVDR
jgi:hypothetical protein